MNQDQVKEFLEPLAPGKPFTVIFSGKASKLHNGLYHPDNAEIIINNKNFTNDEALKYTAIHELAHHVEFTTHGKTNHAGRFQAILSDLLSQAKEAGTYRPDHAPVADEILAIKAKLSEHARLEQEIGRSLLALRMQCMKHDVRMEEVIDQDLRITIRTAKRFMAVGQLELFPESTTDTQTAIAQAPKQAAAEITAAAESVAPISQIKAMGKPKTKPVDPEDSTPQLKREAARIDTTIDRLTRRREEIEETIRARQKAEDDTPRPVLTNSGHKGLRIELMTVSRDEHGILKFKEVQDGDIHATGEGDQAVQDREILPGMDTSGPEAAGVILEPGAS